MAMGPAAELHAPPREPEAAALPFFEHSLEPPLCYAVRTGCGPDILEVLIENQADVNAVDLHGRSPLAVLCSRVPRVADCSAMQPLLAMPSSPFANIEKAKESIESHAEAHLVACAVRLLAAGADMHLPDGQGATPESVALVTGNKGLVLAFKYYHSFQVCATLARAAGDKVNQEAFAETLLGQLPDGLIGSVCAFLVPETLGERLLDGPAFKAKVL
mmetsp:Transcript_59778/g.177889  ORF Transcript_59778/g.177889 Transcript_59778/m.177889 type:complete len:217 (+) Transcript_59778:191-841(+)